MRGIIINTLKTDTWNIQLTIATHIISSKDVDEECVIYSKSNKIEFKTYSNANGVVNKLFESPLFRYQIGIETSMRRSNFIFDSIQLLYYNCHKINFECGGSKTFQTVQKKKPNNKSNKQG